MPNRYGLQHQHKHQHRSSSQIVQLAASVLGNLTHRKSFVHEFGLSKVAAGNASPTKNAKSFKSVKSARSSRSGRSGRTTGRAEDNDTPWEYSTSTPDLLKLEVGKDATSNPGTSDPGHALHSDGRPVYEPGPLVRPSIRQSSYLKKRNSQQQSGDDLEDMANGRPIGKDENLYTAYDMENNDEDDMGDEDDEQDDDPGFHTPEDQDELAYFSQRVGNSDFKLARRLVIHPHGRVRAFWDSILMFLISWILVVVPFELSFRELDPSIRRDLLRFDLFVDCMFAIDIFLNFNTGIERDGKLHFSFRSIYRSYLRGWFVMDVLWTIPFYVMVENRDASIYAAGATASHFAVQHTWLYSFFRCLRLLRVLELPHVQRRLEYSLLISSKISSLGSFLYVVLALSHVFSCMFAHLAFGDQEHLAIAVESSLLQNDDLQTKYIASFYWSMMTMTTVGYGDLTVRTNTGRLFSLAAMVVGGGIFAYGITNVVALFQQLYVDETEHRHKMDQVNTFMHNRALPRKLRDEIRANFFHMRKATRESKEHDYEIFRQMSRTLQSNVATLFCQEMMPHKMHFLAGCSAEFIHELYLTMEVKCYLPGEDIIRQGDYGTEMYFLFVGHVQVFLSHTKVAALGPNAFFGEFGIFNPKKPRLATIQAMDFCETHCIQRRDIFRILVQHPFMLRSIKQLAALRSRKALNILYESGGKSRTLLQGLASVWHQEGILGLLPRGLAIEDFPLLQEYLPVAQPAGASGARRASVRASIINQQQLIDAAAAAGGATGRRKSSMPVNPSTARGMPLRGNAPQSPGKPQRCTSIGVADTAHLVATLASIGNRPTMELFDQARALDAMEKAVGTIDIPSATNVSDERMEMLMHQMQEVVKRQELLDDQLQEILAILASDPHGVDRFREQYQMSASTPPLVRDRSQYFHRDLHAIPEGNERLSLRQ